MSSTGTVDAIVEEITIKASADRVFEALTDPAQRVAWWGLKDRFRDHAHGVRLASRRPLDDARTWCGRKAFSRGRRVSDDRTPARTLVHLVAGLGRACDRDHRAVRSARIRRRYHSSLDPFGLRQRKLADAPPRLAANPVVVTRISGTPRSVDYAASALLICPGLPARLAEVRINSAPQLRQA